MAQHEGEPPMDDPLELEHMMGFDGTSRGSVQYHPTDTTVMISYTGCLVVISDVTDPHQQEFMRGHNEAITCLAVSPSGAMIASGQASTTRVPNSEAMIIVWDYQTRQAVYRLMELHDGIAFSRNRVQQVSFSPDDLFLAGSDDQPGGAKLCVWHTTTGQLATLANTKQQYASFLTWGEVTASTKKINKSDSSYKLHAAVRSQVIQYNLSMDVRSMQYQFATERMQLPSSGLDREYHCAAMVKPLQTGVWELLAGSSAGELCIFNVETKVFRACVPVSKGGVLSLAVREAGADFEEGTAPLVYCGCGDGTLKLLQGHDLQWTCLQETYLEGMVRSLTISADGAELLAGTSEGNIYRLDASSLVMLDTARQATRMPLIASHPKAISCLGFGDSSEWFITASDSGVLRRWELSHYSVDYEVPSPTKTTDTSNMTRADCIVLSSQDGTPSTITGWTDGNIRCFHQEDGQLLWQMNGAHRGGVTCVSLTPLYLVSAGADGAIRIWSDGASRQLLGNFDEHKKRVTGLCVDLLKPKLVHTCGDDKNVVTIDLDQARRVQCHSVKEGGFRSMVQATTGELELITADAAGNLKWWDSDEYEPVSMAVTWSPMQDINKERRLTHIDLSPPMSEGSRGSDFLTACTGSGDLQIWDLRQSACVSIGSAHSDEITQAKWAPDGKQIISVGKDACICVWNFFSGL